MSVAKMKLVSIIGNFNMLDHTIQACINSGCFHVENAIELVSDVRGFTHINDENPYKAELARLTDTMKATGIQFDKEQSYMNCSLSIEQISEYLLSLQENLGKLHEERSKLHQEIDKTQEAIPQFEHFYGLNLPLQEIFASKYIKVRFGRLPAASYEKLQAQQDQFNIVFVPCSKEKNYYWGMYVSTIRDIEKVDRIFSMMFFERLRIPEATGTPEQIVKDLKKELEEKLQRVNQLDTEINKYLENRRLEILSIYKKLKFSYDAFEVRRYSAKYKDNFFLIGFVPFHEETVIQKHLDKVDGIEYKLETPDSNERISPPSKLKNFRLFKPYEYYVDLYGLPCYNEVDPTLFIAITYTIIYGIMFADLGQGLILSLIGFFMYRKKKMDLGKILIPCGISGAVFGTIFGSVFGYENLLDPMFHALGFEEKPIEIMESVQNILIVAIGIGVFLVIVAMIINIYSSFKQKNHGAAIFGPNGIAGLIFYCSLIIWLLSVVLSFSLPFLPFVLICLILPLFCMLMQQPFGDLLKKKENWKPESMGEYLVESFFELFESILSYVTNTLSFLRVGAFVLVHAGLMMAFFILADLMGPIGFLMVILGNIVVIALEGLLVGIQSLRLMFYEMFSRFYIGQGRAFTPLKMGDK